MENNGNYYNGVTYGLYGNNGKEHGKYCLGFRVKDLGSRLLSLGLWVQSLGFRAKVLKFRFGQSCSA